MPSAAQAVAVRAIGLCSWLCLLADGPACVGRQDQGQPADVLHEKLRGRWEPGVCRVLSHHPRHRRSTHKHRPALSHARAHPRDALKHTSTRPQRQVVISTPCLSWWRGVAKTMGRATRDHSAMRALARPRTKRARQQIVTNGQGQRQRPVGRYFY